MAKYPKNVPRVIYLQTGTEPGEDISEIDFEGGDTDVTWCVDNIFATDIAYRLVPGKRKAGK